MDYKDNILFGDALEQLKTIPDETVQMCVTSPPYWGLRDYGHKDQLGLEETPEEYVDKLTAVFGEVKRLLKKDGTLWLNIGDSYFSKRSKKSFGDIGENTNISFEKQGRAGAVDHEYLKPKDCCMIPARVAMSLQSKGWYLRSDIIWHKPNSMPESVKDRPTNSYEHVYLLSKSKKYYYDWESIAEPFESSNKDIERAKYIDSVQKITKATGQKGNSSGFPPKKSIGRNKRNVWSINTKPFSEAHFAVYPPELIAPCIKAGSKPYDIVLDPFFGSGTTGEVCKKLNRHYLGIELNQDNEPIQQKRLQQNTLQFQE